MKISVFAYSRKGCETALNIIDAFEGEEISAWCPSRIIDDEPDIFSPIPKDFRSMYGERFAESDAMVFVGACGIAVREIAPFVKSKKTDPAILVVDDKSRYVIPLLSGHIGGANELAARLAASIGSNAVITTATDINGRFSVDTWAAVEGYHICSMKAAKAVSAEILDKDIPVLCDHRISGGMPPGTYMADPDKGHFKESPGIYIGWRTDEPFDVTLRLLSRSVILGIGCRRGTPSEDIQKAVNTFLADNHIDRRSILSVASIDLKKDEEGLISWCEKHDLPAAFYSAEELNEVEGDFPSSDFVKNVTGTDNVCERSALKDADRIIVHKTAYGNVTLAAAVKDMEVKFN